MTPEAECGGKRSYSGREWAMRALKKLRRDSRERGNRGTIHPYHCELCDGWHLGRGFASLRPDHQKSPGLDDSRGRAGALMFAKADAIAKARFPDGANASQLGQILREVLRDSGGLPEGEDSRSEAECEASQNGAAVERQSPNPTSSASLARGERGMG